MLPQFHILQEALGQCMIIFLAMLALYKLVLCNDVFVNSISAAICKCTP